MTNKLSFSEIEIRVENYTFLVAEAYKEINKESIPLQIKDGPMCYLNLYDENSKLALIPSLFASRIQKSLIYALDERKEFLKKLYNAIRNHPSIRLRMLNTLGPVKQY